MSGMRSQGPGRLAAAGRAAGRWALARMSGTFLRGAFMVMPRCRASCWPEGAPADERHMFSWVVSPACDVALLGSL